ncbi:Citrate synthase (si) [Minicystis rosea]|nr:Citrate synthase (si) [Minicystis rosea]
MEADRKTAAAGGLEGVVVADTRLSEVDGERGRLVIAGRDVEQLAGAVTFEEAAALLWEVPAVAAQKAIAEGRALAFDRIASLGDALDREDGMDALRAATAHLVAAEAGTPARITGAVGTFAAAWARVRQGARPIAPDPSLGHAADYLRMIGGAAPKNALVAGLDAYLVTVIDHGMNASTFTARVVASTGSDLVSAVVAAIGALKGPLHGGAPGPVLDMLDAIGAPERAASWIEGELVAGRRIMGMGHRIYRVRDPRAAVLEKATQRLEKAGVSTGRLALARAVEQAAEGALRQKHPDRPLRANVEFYTAVLLDTVGLDRAAFSPTFAVGRVAGWSAHVEEQRATGRLIRPASRYVGVMPA